MCVCVTGNYTTCMTCDAKRPVPHECQNSRNRTRHKSNCRKVQMHPRRICLVPVGCSQGCVRLWRVENFVCCSHTLVLGFLSSSQQINWDLIFHSSAAFLSYLCGDEESWERFLHLCTLVFIIRYTFTHANLKSLAVIHGHLFVTRTWHFCVKHLHIMHVVETYCILTSNLNSLSVYCALLAWQTVNILYLNNWLIYLYTFKCTYRLYCFTI